MKYRAEQTRPDETRERGKGRGREKECVSDAAVTRGRSAVR